MSLQHLVAYYERFGFKNIGPSKAQFGGGGWHDMVSPPTSQHIFSASTSNTCAKMVLTEIY